MRIAFLTASDPLDRRSWSGTPYHMMRALEARGCIVTPLGPLSTPVRPWLRAYGALRRLLRGGKYLHGHSARYARSCGRAARRALARGSFDVVLAPAASACVAFLETDLPLVYVSDATFRLMVDYYPDFSGLCPATLRDGERMEALALRKAAAVCPPTEWVARSAEADYGVERQRLSVIPFGLNIEPVPPGEGVAGKRAGSPLALLFVGRQWVRKGGDVVVEALRALNEAGVDARLTVCGCIPPPEVPRENMRVIPLIDKNDPAGRAEMERLYASSDFLLLPARSECFGMVVAEASAFGVPSLVAATGGLAEAVVDGRNGHVLPLSARGDAYARVIRAVVEEEDRYERLARASRAEFETRLNWGRWSEAMLKVLIDVSGCHS